MQLARNPSDTHIQIAGALTPTGEHKINERSLNRNDKVNNSHEQVFTNDPPILGQIVSQSNVEIVGIGEESAVN